MVGKAKIDKGFRTLYPCPWRITNCLCQSAPLRGLIFSSTMLTLSSHEEYVHGFHLPCVPNTQTPQTWRHVGIDCRGSPAEAPAVTYHPLAKTRPQSLTPQSFPARPVDHLSGSTPHQPGCLSRQIFHTPEISSSTDQMEISPAVLLTETREARP